MTRHPRNSLPAAVTARPASRGINVVAGALLATVVLLSACTTPPLESPAASAVTPAAAAPVVVAAPPTQLPIVAAPPTTVVAPEPVAQPKEAPLIELPIYAQRGKRLPANGGAPGRAVASYCRSFEIAKDAATYFKTLARTKRLPTASEVAERSRLAGRPQSVQQVVERDWALRRESNKSAPQRCKVLGGSIEGATALIVFEAELNGRRQRGTATVLQTGKTWRVRDHGDWVPAK